MTNSNTLQKNKTAYIPAMAIQPNAGSSKSTSSKSDSHKFIVRLNSCRRKIQDVSNLTQKDKDMLAKELIEFKDLPTVNAFLNSINQDKIDLLPVRNELKKKNPTLIAGYFQVPYNPELNVEALKIEPIELPLDIPSKYPSTAQTVRLVEYTDGFSAPRAVALFPENFVSSTEPKKDDQVYYFINKFAARFDDVTLKVLKSNNIAKNTFPNVKKASKKEIEEIAAIWVHLHEFYHGQGDLALPEHLEYKSNRSVAGLEETRVDIKTIIEANTKLKAKLGSKKVALITEFILAERLLRYPLQKSPQSDYDSRSSTMLLNLLIEHGVAKINILDKNNPDNLQLEIDHKKLLPALMTISKTIDEKENVAKSNLTQARSVLLSFVQSKSIRVGKLYQNHPFIENLVCLTGSNPK
jgi:Family of unknown function (DUF6421)